MPPSRATVMHNLHSAACYGQLLGVACYSCGRRALVPLDRIGAHSGNMTPLHSLALKCTECDGRAVEFWLFITRAVVDTWADGDS